MNIVVTGAAGFIGSHVSQALISRGHHVTGLDSFDDFLYPSERKRRNAAQLSKLPSSHFTLIEGNITDPAAVEKAIAPDTDVVCHLAAVAGVRPSLTDPMRYMHTNIIGTTVVIERMKAIDCRRLSFASSSSVYGARPGEIRGFREDDACVTPASPYAASKRMGELLLSSYRDLFGFGVHALRFFTVFGPRQRPDMAIAKFFDAMIAGRTITLHGDGTSRRDYTFIADIVAGVVASIEQVTPGEFLPINLGGNVTTSLSELVVAIEETIGVKAIIERKPDQPGDVPVTFADISVAKARLGYAPTTTVREGLAQYLDWHRRGAAD
jgi:UDP-glucuronate 4-epimerase